MPGPVGKRSDAKHGHRTKAELAVDKAPGGEPVRWPRADPSWHKIAKEWYASLKKSGQSRYYEQSDVAYAVYVAEAMSRNLDQGRFSAQLFASVVTAVTELLTTEGSRRRLKLELTRDEEDTPDAELKILDDYREMMS